MDWCIVSSFHKWRKRNKAPVRWSQRVEWTPGWRWYQHTFSGKWSKHQTTGVFPHLWELHWQARHQYYCLKASRGTLNNKCCSIYLFEWMYSLVTNWWWTYLRAKNKIRCYGEADFLNCKLQRMGAVSVTVCFLYLKLLLQCTQPSWLPEWSPHGWSGALQEPLYSAPSGPLNHIQRAGTKTQKGRGKEGEKTSLFLIIPITPTINTSLFCPPTASACHRQFFWPKIMKPPPLSPLIIR